MRLCSWSPVLLALASSGLWAQARITQALVYPGGAEVQRLTAVAAGAQEAVFACIPNHYRSDAFTAQGVGAVRTGEVKVQALPKDAAPECSGDAALDGQIRQLEDQIARVQAERSALDLVLGYLKGAGQSEVKNTGVQAATAESIRKQGVDALQQQIVLKRKSEDLTRQLQPLLVQRKAEGGEVGQWLRVTVQVQTAQAGEVRLTGRTSRAGWEPHYRADLDSTASRVQLERLAEVKQTTGESWRNVKLVLSTRQPERAMAPEETEPWRLEQVQPMPQVRAMAAMALPPAPKSSMLERVEVTGSRIDDALPSFESDFDVQFTVPGTSSVASGSERRKFLLDRMTWGVKLGTLVEPARQAQAFLVAAAPRPEGFFPGGTMELLRDGEFVGRSHFDVSGEAEQRLYFGPDDRLRVRVEPARSDAGNTGFIGSRRTVAVQRAYVLENTSGKPLAVQVVEAGPHPQHEDIQVQAKFEPVPAVNAWRELPGVRLWTLTLAPKQSQRLTAEYQLSAPKDMAVAGWP
jgi:uncharacterized protein (TIGR02231 family)